MRQFVRDWDMLQIYWLVEPFQVKFLCSKLTKITLELSKKIHKLSAAHYISFFSWYTIYLNYTCPDLNWLQLRFFLLLHLLHALWGFLYLRAISFMKFIPVVSGQIRTGGCGSIIKMNKLKLSLTSPKYNPRYINPIGTGNLSEIIKIS